MSFSDSDLTELDSDDELPRPQISNTPITVATKSTQKITAANQSKINSSATPRLRPPRSVSYSLSWLHGQLKRHNINVDPEYQRGVVWTESKQRGLIDSLMHNYYIPPLVFSVTRPESDEADIRICIDGKQRLTSIQQFMDGHLSYKDSQSGQKLWYKNLSNKKGKLITAAQRDRFDTTQIVCVEYDTLTDHEEREIFQRVQMGVALSPAERLKAINGSNAELVREMDNKISQEIRRHLHWENAKGKDFLALSRILYLIDSSLSTKYEPSLTETTVVRIETFLQGKFNGKDATTKRRTAAIGAIDTLCCIVQDPSLRRPFSCSKISPFEFVIACYLIHLYRSKLSLSQLSDAVKKLRDVIRGRDTRREKVQKDVAEFVYKKVPVLSLKSDGRGDTPAIAMAGPQEISSSDIQIDVKTEGKRKRGQDTEVYDGNTGAEEKPKKRGRPIKQNTTMDPLDDEVAIAQVPPSRPKTQASRHAVVKAITTGGTTSGKQSAAATTIKRIPKHPALTKKLEGSSAQDSSPQIGTPSIKSFTRASKTVDAVRPSSISPIAQQRDNHLIPSITTHNPSEMPAPHASARHNNVTTTNIHKDIPPLTRSRPSINDIYRLSPASYKSEQASPFPARSSSQPNRLAALHAAKNQVAAQMIMDSRFRQSHPSRKGIESTTNSPKVMSYEDADRQHRSTNTVVTDPPEVLSKVAPISRLQPSTHPPATSLRQQGRSSSLGVNTGVNWLQARPGTVASPAAISPQTPCSNVANTPTNSDSTWLNPQGKEQYPSRTY